MALYLDDESAALAEELARLTQKPLVEALRDCLKRQLELIQHSAGSVPGTVGSKRN